jgi:catechol 2,3-dioxygenase-like lactoylglutathione lyase family enzyme
MKTTEAITLTILAGVMCLGLSFLTPAQNNPASKAEEKKEKTMFKFRVARPTDNLPEIVRFYRDGLGLEVLTSFENHEGFDGVMLGRKGHPYHLEFTHHQNHQVGKAPTQDNLLVFYIPDEAEWKSAVERMRRHGYEPVKSYNPYWDKKGKTFEDVDGYRVVLQNSTWDF